MQTPLAQQRLAYENARFAGTGGISEENAEFGFRPAFCDADTDCIYASRFADGRPAPFHMVDGLPAEVVTERAANGRVLRIKDSVVSGFVLRGRFYTREEASQAVTTLH